MTLEGKCWKVSLQRTFEGFEVLSHIVAMLEGFLVLSHIVAMIKSDRKRKFSIALRNRQAYTGQGDWEIRMSTSFSDSLNFSPLAGDFSAYPAVTMLPAAVAPFAPAATVVAPQAGHVAIVGAGNAAHSLACLLSSRGFHPHVLVRSPDKVRELAERKTIKSTGKIEGEFNIVEATAEPAAMLDKCATIFVATTTGCYSEIARRLAPHLREHHEVILFSSKFGGVCEFKTALGHRNTYPALMEPTRFLPVVCKMTVRSG